MPNDTHCRVPAEELSENKTQTRLNIEKAVTGAFYDGDFFNRRESPFPLYEGDKLILERKLTSLPNRAVALTFRKHTPQCTFWKRFRFNYFTLSTSTKESLDDWWRLGWVSLWWCVFVCPVGLVCGLVGCGLVALIILLSSGTSYVVAYVVGGICAASGCVGMTAVMAVPLGMALADSPVRISPCYSCCALKNENQLYSVVFSSTEEAEIEEQYATEYNQRRGRHGFLGRGNVCIV